MLGAAGLDCCLFVLATTILGFLVGQYGRQKAVLLQISGTPAHQRWQPKVPCRVAREIDSSLEIVDMGLIGLSLDILLNQILLLSFFRQISRHFPPLVIPVRELRV